jgi:hypothetical protein
VHYGGRGRGDEGLCRGEGGEVAGAGVADLVGACGAGVGRVGGGVLKSLLAEDKAGGRGGFTNIEV